MLLQCTPSGSRASGSAAMIQRKSRIAFDLAGRARPPHDRKVLQHLDRDSSPPELSPIKRLAIATPRLFRVLASCDMAPRRVGRILQHRRITDGASWNRRSQRVCGKKGI